MIRDKLYSKDNYIIEKSVNVDDSLYSEIKRLSLEKYSAGISEIVNVAIEEYIERNTPNFYGKKKFETVTYRTLALRKKNIDKLNEYHDNTGISFTRLLNSAIKEFLDNI
ncbi:MAG: hypothetical protein HFJ30_00800 [Clostridia bacterium]|nr:hypothetical protein [Clostridia bacterium]